MANSRSARKQIRASERKRIRNRAARSAVRTHVARARRSLVSGQTADLESELRSAVRALDRAAEKGILHRNNAARRKSRLMAMAARLTAMSGSEQEKAATRAAAAGGSKGTTAARPAASRSRAASAKPAAAKPAAARPAAARPGAGKAPAKRTARSS